MNVELMITNESGSIATMPLVESGIEWTTERQGAPGKLSFKVLGNGDYSEGCAVRLRVDGADVFYGFIFKQKRDKEGLFEITAYDQLRYFKNKDTKVYEGKTASQFLQMLIDDFSLQGGAIENTGYVIPSRVEENATLFDMVQNALDLTLQNTGSLFVLYDDFGKLALKNLEGMKVGENGSYLLIDAESGQNFEYTSSIDDNTYNKVKLTYDNDKTGTREVYIAQSGDNMNRWGTLQYYDTLKENENGQAKANALLNLYNAKTRKLKISKAVGDNRVRAGSMVVVALDLGDTKVQNFMLVEKCVHTYEENEHWMDLTLRGGEFNG